ncbi:hypothetical protein [Sphingobacterium psychroaquaticum]|uniref:DUF2116 family Zn-ribbon domain-containing protein n=1 Tax=Sphingobacterium psychroaquaticum TaxID=561061 RepID=A0A1X7JNF2_9SPHI|nr:hypothetical protein [Sphingobacterium psychroaquaticum]SMG29423.1 hypothetical protein SAMN05660862_1925 [Sphingobacterium psychroaquaticum]
MEEKCCVWCGQFVKGRSDKRFCDDGCRNAYNNKMNRVSNQYVREVNNILKKNRNVLLTVLGEEKTTRISGDHLLREGLDFNFFTNLLENGKGQTYSFVYEYGYLPLGNELFLIVKRGV